MPRASWRGFLRLSLVSCPIYLSPATTRTKATRLRQVWQPAPIDEVEAARFRDRTSALVVEATTRSANLGRLVAPACTAQIPITPTPLARGNSGRIPIPRFGTPQIPDRSSATKSGHFIRYGQAHSAPIDGSPLPFKITLYWASPADTGQVSWVGEDRQWMTSSRNRRCGKSISACCRSRS
jgi:hypothetical protein